MASNDKKLAKNSKFLVIFFAKIGIGGMGIHGGHVARAISEKFNIDTVFPMPDAILTKNKFINSIKDNFLMKIVRFFSSPGLEIEKRCVKTAKKARSFFLNGDYSCVYGFSGVSLESFREAKKKGIPCILDHPNLHLNLFRDSYKGELKKWFHIANYKGHPTENYIRRVDEEFKLADVVRVNSSLAKNSLVSNGVNKNKIVVISQPLEEKYCDQSSSQLKRPNNGRSFVICYVGSMCLRKGFVYLLKAVSQLKDKKIKIIFVGNTGDKYSKNLLKKYQRGLDVEVLPGDPIPVYKNADLFVLPTLGDGFGLVVIEAMSFGIPVIVTDQCGASDLIENGKTGWVINSKSSEQLADAIFYAMNNRSIAIKVGLAGRDRVNENTIEKHDRELVMLIESMLKND